MQYSHHHNHEYHQRKMKASDTILLTAIGIIVGVSVLILASEAFAADVRVTRPATTVDSQVNSTANLNVGPVNTDTTLRADTDAELRSDRGSRGDASRNVNDDADSRTIDARSDMNNTVRGPLWSTPGIADDPDNRTGTVRNDITSVGGNIRNTGRGGPGVSLGTNTDLDVGISGSR